MAYGSKGSDWKEYRAVMIDIHQCLVNAHHSPDLGEPKPGAVEFIKELQGMDVLVWLSCGGFRPPADDYKKKVKLWLERHGIDPAKVRFWADQKVIIAINDRGWQFKGWPEARKEAIRRIKELDKTHDPDPAAS